MRLFATYLILKLYTPMRNACFDSTTCNDSACVSGHISLFSIKERPPFMSTAFTRNPYENTLCIAKIFSQTVSLICLGLIEEKKRTKRVLVVIKLLPTNHHSGLWWGHRPLKPWPSNSAYQKTPYNQLSIIKYNFHQNYVEIYFWRTLIQFWPTVCPSG